MTMEEMEWTYFDAREHGCFEFGMTQSDAQMCSHMGRCDDDCATTRQLGYIRKQLDCLTDEQMGSAIREYGVEFEEYEGRSVPRDTLELYIVWLAAGNITEDIYERAKLAQAA